MNPPLETGERGREGLPSGPDGSGNRGGQSTVQQSPRRPSAGGSRQRVDYRLKGLDLSQTEAGPPAPPPRPSNPGARRALRRLTTGWVIVLVVGTITGLLLRFMILQPYTVTSSAMMPVLHTGDRIVVVTASLLTGPVQRGDIVVFEQPAGTKCGGGPSDELVERVIGLPGETIWSYGQTIYIDDRPLQNASSYDHRFGQLSSSPIALTTLGPHDYFVLVDNPKEFCDSRSFGEVPGSSILGKAVAVVMRGGRPYLHLL